MSKLFQILTTSEKIKVFYFSVLIFCASLLETIGVGIIPMFLFFLNDPENYIGKIPYDDLKYILMNLDYDKQIFYFLILIGIFFIIKNLFLFFLVLFETKFKKDMKILISENLMKHYLSMNYIFHTNNNPILLARNVGSEVNNVAIYMVSLVLLFREILLILLILSILLFVDVQSSIYTVLSFVFLIITYFYFSKKKN